MKCCLDTSAFLKLFVLEQGAEAFRAATEEASQLALSTIAIPEAFAALNRYIREGRLTLSEYEALKLEIEKTLPEFQLLELDPATRREAVRLVERFPLRGMDAIHLAAARCWGATEFLTADRRQGEAAQALGFAVLKVNL